MKWNLEVTKRKSAKQRIRTSVQNLHGAGVLTGTQALLVEAEIKPVWVEGKFGQVLVNIW